MNQNRLVINQVAGNSIVEYELDLYDNVPLPINKSIIDIQNIAERKSDFTKTITLPGTHNNNDIFSNIFNLARSVSNTNTYNFAPDFNPNLKANAILYKNEIAMIDGYLQLSNVNVLDDYEIEYEVTIIGKNANLFQDLGDKKLNELNLSAFDHTWNFTNIQNSWIPSATRGYYYGLIDSGLSNDQRGFFTKDQKPQIFLRAIVDAIFKDSGYRYASIFLTTGHFNKLVVPTTQDKLLLTNSQIIANTFEVDIISSSLYAEIFHNTFTRFPLNNIVQNTTPTGGYNNTTYEFVVQKTGKYVFNTDVKQDFRYITWSPGNPSNIEWYVILKKNGQNTITTNKYYDTLFSTSRFHENIKAEIYCEAGDVIELVYYFNFRGGSPVNRIESSIVGGSFLNGVIDSEIVLGATMQLSSCLPNDIKQSDFLVSVINLFNLYVESDTLDPKKLIIEPRDQFYLPTLVDLTNKVDVSRTIEIKPLSELKFKEYNYQMEIDKDAANENFNLRYAQPYGSAKISINNDFVNENFTTKVLFAPTPLLNSKNPKVIFTQIVFRNSSGERINGTSKLRLLYAGGLSASIGTNFFHFEDPNGTKNYFNAYPYVGHLDSITNPTFDVNFYKPKEIFYTTNTKVIYTDNNLFNLYHKKGLQEITNKDSKTVILFANLSENEINKLSFRNSYLIDKKYYRLYEVDFDSNSKDPAKLTFLKLAVAPDFIGTQINVYGGSDDEMKFFKRVNPNGNIFTKDVDLNVSGNENIVQGSANLVNSNNNIVNGDLINVLSGSDNQLNNNNGTYLNCNNYESVRDGEVVINNIDQPLLATHILTVSELNNLNTTPITILAAQSGYWTEIYDAYITVFFDGQNPQQGYNSHKLHLEFAGEGNNIIEFDNGITAVVVATKQKGVNKIDIPFRNLAIDLHSAGNLGASGNSQILIELEYRLHPIIS